MKQMRKKYASAIRQRKGSVNADPFRQTYHLMSPIGSLADPNGLCQKDGVFHIFHQYSAAQDLGLFKAWGHYVSKDLLHFENAGFAMYPDTPLDKDGCYSGSAYVHDGKMHVFYTGNSFEEGDHDYILSGRGHVVMKMDSENGVDFSEKRLILANKDYPSHMSCHVRDPKITRIKDTFYMLLGARTRCDKGCALVYVSKDLEHFDFLQELHSEEAFGYMWECPDLVNLDGSLFLVTCPQGVGHEKGLYQNQYANGYFEVAMDAEGKLSVGAFHELDKGFDFYAPQSFEDESGRRIQFSWMGMADASYAYKEKDGQWLHCMGLPRELRNVHGKIHTMPVAEIRELLKNTRSISLEAQKPQPLESSVFHMAFDAGNVPFVLDLRHDVQLSWKEGLMTLTMKESGAGRDVRYAYVQEVRDVEIYSDTSSLEIFVNQGEVVLSTRVYDAGRPLAVCSDRSLMVQFSEVDPISIVQEETELQSMDQEEREQTLSAGSILAQLAI